MAEDFQWIESGFPFMDIVLIYGEWIEQKEKSMVDCP